MSVLINGMKMPIEGTVLAIYKIKGQFYASMHDTKLYPLDPVVMCKDCKYSGLCTIEDEGRVYDEEFFCKWGKEREDGRAIIPGSRADKPDHPERGKD